ncbi:hypothetical protein [Maliponia aquimaris]|uniref:Uncharacterized protein n=1 Tax=Maliponia aquimaris TaxID=1673631 RepID=A0A238K108_9RHOB|nr:hypothetical protein [Maliponia aquimaris]SMX36601.1 hypothetical protein MAA8898_00925 [Maliponia aquimaris]
MSDLKSAILDAKYVDMIDLGDFVVRDTGLPDVDSDGNLMPQATEIAAAIFRWAADMKAAEAARTKSPAPTPVARPAAVPASQGGQHREDPMAEALDAELNRLAQEQG